MCGECTKKAILETGLDDLEKLSVPGERDTGGAVITDTQQTTSSKNSDYNKYEREETYGRIQDEENGLNNERLGDCRRSYVRGEMAVVVACPRPALNANDANLGRGSAAPLLICQLLIQNNRLQ